MAAIPDFEFPGTRGHRPADLGGRCNSSPPCRGLGGSSTHLTDFNDNYSVPRGSRSVTPISQLSRCLSQQPDHSPAKREDRMKVLIASTPATGHLNPFLALGRILIAEGHEVVCLSGSLLRGRIESIGADFRPLPLDADF